jgi:hypothetical protein
MSSSVGVPQPVQNFKPGFSSFPHFVQKFTQISSHGSSPQKLPLKI